MKAFSAFLLVFHSFKDFFMLSLRFFCYFVLHFLIVDPIPALTVCSRCLAMRSSAMWRETYTKCFNCEPFKRNEEYQIVAAACVFACFQFHMQIRWKRDGCKGWEYKFICRIIFSSNSILDSHFLAIVTHCNWICINYWITTCYTHSRCWNMAGKLMIHCSRVMKTFCFIAQNQFLRGDKKNRVKISLTDRSAALQIKRNFLALFIDFARSQIC